MVVSVVTLYGLVFELLKLTSLVRISKHLPRIFFSLGKYYKPHPGQIQLGMRSFDRYRRQSVSAIVARVWQPSSDFSAVDDVFLYRYIARSLYKEENAPISFSLPQRRDLKAQ